MGAHVVASQAWQHRAPWSELGAAAGVCVHLWGSSSSRTDCQSCPSRPGPVLSAVVLQAALPQALGGLAAPVLYVDTEGKFSSDVSVA